MTRTWIKLAAVLGLLAWAAPLPAQVRSGSTPFARAVFAGEEMEDYLRVLQLGGLLPSHPWSVRGFSGPELEVLLSPAGPHPWSERPFFAADSAADHRGAWVALVPPELQARYNSGFPYGSADAALWAGRGLSTSLRAGVAARAGPVTLVAAPTVVWAQNADFPLAPPQVEGAPFGDRRFDHDPGTIDLPQRFGDGAYLRLDPGESTLRVDGLGVAAGISTAAQVWGPAVRNPLLLGNNAPGFLHAFVGTSTPRDVFVGRVHGRAVWGRLDESPYSPAPHGRRRRMMAGLVGVFTPRGLDGVELGAARFFHLPWTDSVGPGTDLLLRPFEGLLKTGTADPFDRDADRDANQLFSVFARWTAPRLGFEAYGELLRDDHSFDFRDLVLEPDHSSAYLLGFRRVWRVPEQRYVALRGEVVNTQASHLKRVRHQAAIYSHHALRQGHTHRGQLLAGGMGYGGGGSVLAVDYLHPGGRWTVSWSRELRSYLAPDSIAPGTLDVMHGLGVEALLFRGPLHLVGGVHGVYNRNRDFRSDAFNLNAALALRMGL